MAKAETESRGVPRSGDWPAHLISSLARLDKRLLVSSLLLLGALLLLYRGMLGEFFYSDDFVLLRRVRDRSLLQLVGSDFFGNFSESDMPFWRPSSYLLIKVLHTCFGPAPLAYVITSLLLHFGVTVLVQVAAARATGRPLLGFAAGALFLSSPAYVEGVSWIAAALNVIPAALLLLVATLLYVRFVIRGGRRYWWLAFLAFALSLTFKEAGYHFPLVVFAAHLTLDTHQDVRRKLSRAARQLLVFLVPVAVHYLWFNRVDTLRFGIHEQVVLGYRLVPVYLENIFAVPLTPAVTWIGLGVLLPPLFAVGSPRARFLLLWAIMALFPYALQTSGSRFAYFCHIPIALFFPIFLHDLLQQKGKTSIIQPAAILLIGLAFANMLRVPREVDHHKQMGETCRKVLAWCREHRIDRFDDICVDTVPADLLNGFGAMLDIVFGKSVCVRNLLVVRRPPFLIHGIPKLPDPALPILHFDPGTKSYSLITRKDLVADLIPVPLFSFCYDYEIVASNDEALARIRAGSAEPLQKPLLVMAPSPRLQPAAPGENKIEQIAMPIAWRRFELRVSTVRDALLLMCFPNGLEAGGAVEIDARPARLLSANGLFHAVAVPRGSKLVVIHARSAQ